MLKSKISVGIVTYYPNVNKLRNQINTLIEDVDKIFIFDNTPNSDLLTNFKCNNQDRVIIIDSRVNKGISFALNTVSRMAYDNGSDWILTLDQDSMLPQSSISIYLKAINENDDDVAIFCPSLSNNDSSIEYQKTKECITSGSLVKLSSWKAIGGYDDRMFIDLVDFEFCHRLNKKKYKIIRINNLTMAHELGKLEKVKFFNKKIKTYNHNSFRNYYYVRNSFYYARKHFTIKHYLYVVIRLFIWELRKIFFEKHKFSIIKSSFKGYLDSYKMNKRQRDFTVDKINIAVFFHDSHYMSGATKSMIDLLEGFDSEKHKFTLFFPSKGSATDYLTQKGYEVQIAKYYQFRKKQGEGLIKRITHYLPRKIRYLNNKYFNHQIKTTLRKNNIDIIYTNTSTIFTGYWMSQKLSIAHIWHIREFGIEDQKYDHFNGFRKFKENLNKTDKIIVISESLRNKYQDKRYASRISVVYDDISKEYINPTDRNYLINSNTIKALSVGSLIEGKGHKAVIDAVRMLVNKDLKIALSIAGDIKGQYANYLIDYVKKTGMEDHVKFLGQIENMNELRSKSDLAIIASKSEAFGRVTIESMLSNMLVIASNTGANPELVSHDNGFLYLEGDIINLARVIEEVINDREKMIRIANNSYNFALKYTKNMASLTIENIISDLDIYGKK